MHVMGSWQFSSIFDHFNLYYKGLTTRNVAAKYLANFPIKKFMELKGSIQFFGPKMSETSQNLTSETLSSEKGP